MNLADQDHVILASASPRRLELLTQAGVKFEVIVPGVDETPLKDESPQAMVERLAALKAGAVAATRPDALVIGADTTVYIDGVSLGKPGSDEEAYEMLGMIQGRTHQVWGGIAVIRSGIPMQGGTSTSGCISRVWSHVTEVTMRQMSSAQIKEYVATREPLDKAGSYAIQGIGLQYVDSIKGSYSNVVGLNIASLMGVLRELR
jgi:septum formation protein